MLIRQRYCRHLVGAGGAVGNAVPGSWPHRLSSAQHRQGSDSRAVREVLLAVGAGRAGHRYGRAHPVAADRAKQQLTSS